MRQQVLCQLIIICDGLVFHGVFLGSAQCSGDKLQIHWVKMNRNGIQAPTHTLGEGKKKSFSACTCSVNSQTLHHRSNKSQLCVIFNRQCLVYCPQCNLRQDAQVICGFPTKKRMLNLDFQKLC